ncbi:hypothetical protein G6011_03560 [Alternaria panax]|uniref:DUF6604 domain-containing protein n=1 Tax=Alternaria panax TaxID=48097 RepID=A0AAD4NU55_9PLEO|nr:hypothetical protein G6011_03560 [Alternaria panax]
MPPSKPTELEYTVEESIDSVVEAYMAMTMLMNDLSRIRVEIADLRARHKAREMDLATISVATNTAIQLAHSMEDEVYPLMKSFVEKVPLHELYWVAICKEAGYDALKQTSWLQKDDYNFHIYDVADALFSPLINYSGKWDRFDENARQPPKTNRDECTRDKSTLQGLFQDLTLLFNRPGVIKDQFVHAFAAARTSYEKENTNKQPPVWVSSAF